MASPSSEKSWKELDESFSSLVGGSPSPRDLKEHLFRYLPLASAFAAKLLRGKTHEFKDPDGEACDVILDLVHRVDKGKFSFKGKARFSSYLFTIISNRARGKRYVPAAVNKLGKPGVKAFRLIYLDGFDRKTATGVISNEFELPYEQAFQLCRDAVIAAEQSSADKRRHEKPVSLDARFGDMLPLGEHLRSHYAEAEKIAVDEAQAEQVTQILAEMEPSQAELLRRLHMTSAKNSLRDVADQLGLKSPSYSYKQALETFKDMLRKEATEGNCERAIVGAGLVDDQTE